MSHIFPFVASQPNPIGGCASGNYRGDPGFKHCSWDCVYCWAKDLKTRFQYPKYQGPWRWVEDPPEQGEDEFPWVCDMIDIGDPTIPEGLILRLLDWIGEQPCPVLTLTKNPEIYNEYIWNLPDNLVAGVTIETDLPIKLDLRNIPNISEAPNPLKRINDIVWASCNRETIKYFVCIEPIMKFTADFAKKLKPLEPWAVAVGYDNYGHGLPEPSLAETEALIAELEKFTMVYRKTMRKATPFSKNTCKEDSI